MTHPERLAIHIINTTDYGMGIEAREERSTGWQTPLMVTVFALLFGGLWLLRAAGWV